MKRIPPAFSIALVACLVLLVPSAAQADPRTSDLVSRLKSEDFRVRSQAALALGATGDDAAVKPLCAALGDSNETVRTAAATALGKLGKPAGLPCLKTAEGSEKGAHAKSQIQKSIAALGSSGGGTGGGVPAPPPPGPDTKFYVAVEIINKTSRPAAEIEAIVRGAMQAKLLSRSGYAVAPKGEAAAQGGSIVKSRNLKGFLLIATVEAPAYASGALTQIVRVSMWTYPEKALQGEFAPRLTQSGTTTGDVQSENVLMKTCVENAIESFFKVAASL